MQIKLIAEGSSIWDRLIRKWGVSFLINEDILFDTFGHPRVFLNNIHKMNIDIFKIHHIILSHDHWDHITGIWGIIAGRKDITVYICPGFKEEIKDRIKSSGVTLVEVKEPMEISPGIFLTGQMRGRSNGVEVLEQSGIIKTEKGITVLTGCAHAGILAIVNEVNKQVKGNIYCIIGGLHLKNSRKEEIESVIHGLRVAKLAKIVPVHCTGSLAQRLISKEYRELCIAAKPGTTIEV